LWLATWQEAFDATSVTGAGGFTGAGAANGQGAHAAAVAGAAGTFAKIAGLTQISNNGTNSISLTFSLIESGSGGTAAAGNAFLALVRFKNNYYASFWNPDTPAVSKIRKYTALNSGATKSDAWVGSGDFLKPVIGLFSPDGNVLYAILGGAGAPGKLLSTTDGDTWTDRTDTLPEVEGAIPELSNAFAGKIRVETDS
jgi:hypothetical protein